MFWWNLVNTIIAVIALVGVYYAARKYVLAREERKETSRHEDEDNEWANKFTRAIQHLSNIVPRFFTGVQGRPPPRRLSGQAGWRRELDQTGQRNCQTGRDAIRGRLCRSELATRGRQAYGFP